MKIVMQRVKRAAVSIDEATVGAIDQGLLLLVGVGPDDQQEDLDYAVRKIVNMRIFSDDNGKMNLSVQDIKGKILSVSQFTLFAETKKAIAQLFQVLQSLRWQRSIIKRLMLPYPNLSQLKQGNLVLICR